MEKKFGLEENEDKYGCGLDQVSIAHKNQVVMKFG